MAKIHFCAQQPGKADAPVSRAQVRFSWCCRGVNFIQNGLDLGAQPRPPLHILIEEFYYFSTCVQPQLPSKWRMCSLLIMTLKNMYFNSLKKSCSDSNVRISKSSHDREHQNLIPVSKHIKIKECLFYLS